MEDLGGLTITMSNAIGKYRWTICGLIFFATTTNYLDRVVIGLLKKTLSEPDKFNWTESDYANIVVVFQLCYALGMIGAGRLIDKLGTKIGYALATTLWSIAAIAHGAVTTTLGFFVARGALGVTEAGNFPAAIKAVAEWFPKKERALATGIFNSGTNVGAIVAPLTVPYIAKEWGWEWAFILTGLTGFIWLILWFLMYEVPKKHKKLSQAEYDYIHSDVDEQPVEENKNGKKLSWFKLLTFRQTWAFAVGKFLTDPIWWFYLFWLPDFLKKEYGLSETGVAVPLAVAYTLATVGSIFGGWLPMNFIKQGMPVFRSRKTSMLIYALAALPVVSAQYLGDMNMWLAVCIIGFAMAAHQAWSANIFTTVSDMFPKPSIGSVIGIGGMFGALGGIIVSKSAGALFDSYKYAGIAKSWVEAKAAGFGDYISKILDMKMYDRHKDLIDLNKVELRSLGTDMTAQLQSLDAVAFEKLKAIQTPIVQSSLSSSYLIMFIICGCAYIIAWLIMQYLVPKMKRIEY